MQKQNTLQFTRDTRMGDMHISDEFSVCAEQEGGMHICQRLRSMWGGIVLVMDQQSVVKGFITHKEMINAIAEGQSPAHLTSSQVMNSDFYEVNEDEVVGDVMSSISERYPNAVIVVNHENKCMGYFSPSDYQEALALIGIFNKRFDSNDAEAWRVRGLALHQQGKTEEALQSFEQSIKMDPAADKAWFSKALTLERSGRVDEAIKCYDEVLRLNPASHEAWFNKGNAQVSLNRMTEALNCYKESMRIKPDKLEAYINKANVMVHTNQLDNALDTYKKALQYHPHSDAIYYQMGNAYDRFEREKDAIKCYDAAIEINPNHEDAWFNKGASLHSLKKDKKAIKCFEQVLMINPMNMDARDGISICKGN